MLGTNKYEPLTKFLDSILDGTANLKVADKPEEFVPSPEEKMADPEVGITKEEPVDVPTERIAVETPASSTDHTAQPATEGVPVKDEL